MANLNYNGDVIVIGGQLVTTTLLMVLSNHSVAGCDVLNGMVIWLGNVFLVYTP